MDFKRIAAAAAVTIAMTAPAFLSHDLQPLSQAARKKSTGVSESLRFISA